MSTTSLPKLRYFAIKGLAELARVLLHIGNIPFEDIRYPFQRKEDGGINWSEEYLEAKKSGAFAANMDRVPDFEIDGFHLGQSKAIEKYISRRCNLLGSSPRDEALIDNVVENIRDIKEKYGKIRWSPDGPEKVAATSKWFNEELKEWLIKLEKSLPVNESDVLVVGTSVSYADISIWSFFRDYFTDVEAFAKAEQEAGVHRLTAIANRVGEIESLKSYLATRPADI
eukprot:gene14121-15614_t